MLSSPTAIPAFIDNYIWAICQGSHCVVVDPGDAAPVETFLSDNALTLSAILITHHHPDHVGGIAALTASRNIPVYGPAQEKIPAKDHPLDEGDTILPPGLDTHFHVIAVPGHTLGHIAFYNPERHWLFCGDTLFAGGCGRLFEGTPAQMHCSLNRLAELPGQTRVYCAHEYTESNLTFAAAVTPEDKRVQARLAEVKRARSETIITLPSTLAEEKDTNPFLRTSEGAVIQACQAREPGLDGDEIETFAVLRRWKDNF